VALVFTIFAVAALLVAITGALVTGSANSKASWNYRGASQAHFVAESAVTDALQNINGTGVINYQADVVNGWTTRWPTNYFPRNFAPLNGFSYTVTTVAGANPQNLGRLIATATGPDGLTNRVVADLMRSDKPSTAPGAIYLATDASVNSTFIGNNFLVDGNDHNYTGGYGPAGAVPGISTRTDTNTQDALTSLGNAQKDNVQGLGYQAGPPIVPSISTSPSAPTISQMDQFIADLQAAPGATVCPCDVLNNSCTAPGCAFGNPPPASPPLCTIVTAGDGNEFEIPMSGNLNGCGVLIIDGDLEVKGTIGYKGMILVKGKLRVIGDATIYGTLWAQGIELDVGGSGIVYNSSQALALANNIIPAGALPTPMTVTSLADCAEVPAGVGGC
jgi:hypothetical protein